MTSPQTKQENQDSDVESTGTSRIFLLNGDALGGEENNKDIVQLRHPSTGGPGMFLLSSDNTTIQEVQTFSDEFRSWFIDESVKSEGDLFISTPVDPLFLVLPYFIQVKRCMPLDQVLTDDEYPEVSRLITLLKSSLKNIADLRGPEEINAWELNEDKLLHWLKAKTEKVVSVLKSKGIHVGPTAVSNTFVKTKQDTPENYLKYAHGIVSEYLSEEIREKLSQFLGIPSDTALKRKSQDASTGSATKKPKLESIEPESSENDINTSQYFQPSLTPKPTTKEPSAKDKARIVAAKGTKSISSFFTKK